MTSKERRDINYLKNKAEYYKKLFLMLNEGHETGNVELEKKAKILFGIVEDTKWQMLKNT